MPIAAWAIVDDSRLCLRGMISDIDGFTLLRKANGGAWYVHLSRSGMALAEELLQRGGEAILRDIYGSTRSSGVGKS